MVRSRSRPILGIEMYIAQDSATNPMGQESLYARTVDYGLPVAEQAYIELVAGVAPSMVPERFASLGEFTMVLEDYTQDPEAFYGQEVFVHHREVVSPAAGSTAQVAVNGRHRCTVKSVDRGRAQRGEQTRVTITFQPHEIWFRATGAPASFAHTAPTPMDTLRIDADNEIYWSQGVDRLAERDRVLGRS